MEAKRLRHRLLIVLMSVMFVLVGLFAVACSDNNRDTGNGEEIGVYYNDDNGSEYLITLSEGNKFTFAFGTVNQAGTYALLDGAITFVYGDKSGSLVGSLDGDAITVQYDGKNMQFLKKVNYTVTYMSDGTTYKTEQVLNGKTVSEPAAPAEKSGYTFAGWYTDAQYKNKFMFSVQPVRGNITLYAYWFEGVAGEEEFTIDFAGAGEYASMTTIAGKLIETPVPEKSGDTFLGWWVSMYDDAEKLSYQYTDGMTFTQDTTLFALWQSDGELTVSVTASGITWTPAVGTSYNWSVKNSDGKTIDNGSLNASGSVTEVDFSSLPAGDYTITVNNTIRYYKNKALAAVSLFEVVGSTLKFNAVENATEYLITIVCGNADHAHTDMSIGASTTYDFSNCEMPKEGITFVVTAAAEGFASTPSRTFTFARALDEVTGISYDAETGILSWTAVENATGYVVTINGKSVDVGTSTSYTIKDYTGEIAIDVKPVAEGYYSESGTYNFTKETLATPSNLKITDTTLTWNKVAGAVKYEIKIGDEVKEATSETIDLSVFSGWVKGSDYVLTVRAIGSDKNSIWSDEIDIRYYQMYNSLNYADGEVTWRYVVGASSYEVKVNDGAEQKVVGLNRAEIKFTQTGENTIAVRFTDAKGEKSEWAELTVTAYEMKFDAQGGTAVASYYFAAGDYITLPDSTTMTGYDFNAWYSVPNGPLNNGKRYEDGRFTENENVVLYAYWTAKKIEVSFASDEYGEDVESAIVTYDSGYTLPVPAIKTGKEEYIFLGWYNGSTQYTDQDGNALKDEDGNVIVWKSEDSLTFTARWQKVFSFSLLSYSDTYSVSADSTGIRSVTKVTIPATFNGKAVTVVGSYAFYMCSTLEIINIPNCVTLIEGSTAFYASDNLKEINVYDVGTRNPVYESSDGGLLYRNEVEDRFEILFVPVSKTGTYAIPEGITAIPIKAFANSKISEIVIPTTVTRIETNAFFNCKNLTKVTFTAGGTQALTFGETVFRNCTALASFTLPARVEELSADIFTGCTALSEINVESGSRHYSSKDGFLCSADGRTLVYCPTGRTEWQDFIPAGITTIASYAFQDCVEITVLNIPYYVTTIQSYAFYNCIGIGEIVFATNSALTEIADYAFSGCINLYSVTIPASVQSFSATAFAGCANLESILIAGDSDYYVSIDGVIFNKEMTVLVYFPAGKTGRFEIPSGISTIADYMFSGTGITEIFIPNTVTYIGQAAFYNCARLTVVEFEDGELPLKIEDGVFVNSQPYAHYTGAFADCTSIVNLVLPSRLQYLGTYTFEVYHSVSFYALRTPSLKSVVFASDENGNSQLEYIGTSVFMTQNVLESVVLPDGLEEIPNNSFKGTAITSVTLPSKLKEIGDGAFMQTKITELFIPKTVTYIGGDAFYGCTNLAKVEFEKGGTEDLIIDDGMTMAFGYGAFGYCTSLYDFEVPARCTYLGNYTFRQSTYLGFTGTISGVEFNGRFTFEEGSKLQTIGSYAFQATRISSIEIPSSVKTIATWAFYNCPNLTTVKLNEGLETIDDRAFSGASSANPISSIVIPASVKTIGDYAFYNNLSLKSLEIKEGSVLESIGAYSFCGTSMTSLSAMETAVIRSTVGVTIGNWAFAFCGNLTSLTLDNVTAIGDVAFGACLKLQSVTIPSTVKTIGDGAFNTCSALKTVTFVTDTNGVSQLTSIGEEAFFECVALESVALPKGLEEIGASAFISCAALQSVTISDTVTSIGANAFDGCVALTSISVPASVKTIGAEAFAGCEKLATVTFAEGLTEIGANAFDGTALTAITLPASLTTIGDSAFNGTSITSITIPASMTEINVNAFKGIALESLDVATANTVFSAQDGILYNKDKSELILCPAKKSGAVSIPGTVTKIGNNAFSGCYEITAITFEQGTANLEIGDYAFASCGALKAIVIPARTVSVGAYAFYDCADLDSVTFESSSKLTSVGTYAFSGTEHGAVFTSFAFPASVTSIGTGVFSGCELLTTVTIPSGLVIEDPTAVFTVFNGCTSITEFSVVESDNIYLGTENGALFYTKDNEKTLVYYSATNTETSYTVPSDVTAIAAQVFQKNATLTAITVPASLKTIGVRAFESSKIASVTFEGESKLASIGNYAFSVSALTSISIPDSVETIGSYAFYNSTSLTEVTIGGDSKLTTIDTYAFFGCSKLESIYIPAKVTSIGNYAFGNTTSLGEVEFADGTADLTLGNYAFSGSSKIGSIALPARTISIGNYAFSGTTAMKEISFAPTGQTSKLTSIGTYAFQSSGLTEITIPASVTSIGSLAFKSCASLTTVIFAEGGTELELVAGTSTSTGMFNGCSGLESVTLPGRLKTVSAYTFYNCAKLTSVTIPEGVTAIGNYAFYGTGLTAVTIPSSVETIGTYVFYNTTSMSSVTFTNTEDNPCSLTTIGNYAFRGSAITSVTIPNTVTSIGTAAFYLCASLTEVTFASNGSGTLAITAGSSTTTGAFAGCTKLETVTLCNRIMTLSAYTFYGCTALKEIEIPYSVTSIGKAAFYNCTSLESLTFQTGGIQPITITAGTSTTGAFGKCTSLETITFTDRISLIGAYTFYGCTSLESVYIPNSVESIGAGAFYGCTGLLTVTFQSDGVVALTIAAGTSTTGVFGNCTNLETVILTDCLTTLGAYAFYNCSSLATVMMFDGVTSIGNYAFYGCAVEDLYLPNTLTAIGTFALGGVITYSLAPGNVTFVCDTDTGALYDADMTTLYRVPVGYTGEFVIPATVTTIIAGAFCNCTSITSVTIPATVTTIGASAFSGWTADQTIIVAYSKDALPSGWNASWNGGNATVQYAADSDGE